MRTIALLALLTIPALMQAQMPEIHRQATVVDLHSDVLLQVMRGADIAQRLPYGQVDLVRLREGGVDVQFFAVWPDPGKYLPDGMYRQALNLIGRLDELIAANSGKMELARNVADIRRIVAAGKLAACLGVEGGTAIEDDLAKLESLYRRGVRYLGLTWNDSPSWATSAKDEYEKTAAGRSGLTGFGRLVIRRMNELGMMVDLSHAGEETFRDALEETVRPVIASHSAVYAKRHHYRNLKDWQIRAIAENGGVIGINFFPVYLDYAVTAAMDSVLKNGSAHLDSMRQAYQGNYLGYRAYRSAYLYKNLDHIPAAGAVADHIGYIIDLVGEDHVALGTDYDGISIAPAGLEDVGKLPNLTRELIRRGYSEQTISKILGGNFLRVMQAQDN